MIFIFTSNGQIYRCEERPIKASNSIKGYGETTEFDYDPETKETTEHSVNTSFEFSGISDFSGYSLTDEAGSSVEFSTDSKKDENTITQLAIAEVYEKQLAQDNDILTTQLAVAEIYELLDKGRV